MTGMSASVIDRCEMLTVDVSPTIAAKVQREATVIARHARSLPCVCRGMPTDHQ